MSSRTLVTAALPYANGSLHLGHLVEYCQADMYVRALTRLGQRAHYICANDAHGTPIEVNAGRLGVTPEALVEGVHREHLRDFGRFDVAFDHFSITHSDTNRRVVETVYAILKGRGDLEEREVDGNYCEPDKRFLPDRFIKGTCPKCGTVDQYGDVCESCGATYAPTDLVKPYCVLCKTPPVIRKSRHVFFKLSEARHVDFLRRFIDSGALQADVANYVRNWVDGGLRDWCISRDGPYFGFAIPGIKDKYFYVWMDAPLGYVASSVEWGEKHGLSLRDLWQSPNTRVEHIIGKDIMYFHTLFWPAVLEAVGYTLPSKVHVHGMLTVNGEKMSKSRGTFIKAATFAEHVEPQALRYYYACKYSATTDDMDLSFDDFISRVNGELVNKHANLFSRVSQFLTGKLDGNLGDLPFAAHDTRAESDGSQTPLDLARQVVACARRIEALYQNRDFGQVVRELSAMADIGNEFMQAQKPWDQLKTDPEAARRTCTFAANVCHALSMYLWPIVPRFAEAGARVLGSRIEGMRATTLFQERNRPIGTFERLFERIDKAAVEAVVAASKPQEAAPAPTAAPLKEEITYDDFSKLDLRVAVVLQAEPVPKSQKLLKLQVDAGEGKPRQIIAGLAQVYKPEDLIGTRVVIVANLKAAKLMGHESRGMVLAGGEPPNLAVLRLDRELAAGDVVR